MKTKTHVEVSAFLAQNPDAVSTIKSFTLGDPVDDKAKNDKPIRYLPILVDGEQVTIFPIDMFTEQQVKEYSGFFRTFMEMALVFDTTRYVKLLLQNNKAPLTFPVFLDALIASLLDKSPEISSDMFEEGKPLLVTPAVRYMGKFIPVSAFFNIGICLFEAYEKNGADMDLASEAVSAINKSVKVVMHA